MTRRNGARRPPFASALFHPGRVPGFHDRPRTGFGCLRLNWEAINPSRQGTRLSTTTDAAKAWEHLPGPIPGSLTVYLSAGTAALAVFPSVERWLQSALGGGVSFCRGPSRLLLVSRPQTEPI